MSMPNAALKRIALLRPAAIVLLAAIAALVWWRSQPPAQAPVPAASAEPSPVRPSASLPAFLPAEAHATIALIRRGGPFPHRQDGAIFQNREGHLPQRPRGWYREYTVRTPGVDHRGARRIVTGGQPPETWYYTADHYDSFRQFSP